MTRRPATLALACIVVAAATSCAPSPAQRGQAARAEIHTQLDAQARAPTEPVGTQPARHPPNSPTAPTLTSLDWGTLTDEDAYFFEARLTHPQAFPDIPTYASASFAQRTIREANDVLVVQTATLRKLPRSQEPYPLRTAPTGEFADYLKATARVQSKDPRIAAIAQTIIAQAQPRTISDLVDAVVGWTQANIRWGEPNDIPDAIKSIEQGVANCIGFTHAAAAILRHLGVPTRNVRTFVAVSDGRRTGLTRHYLLEVYYPEAKQWVMYEPQGRGVIPAVGNIYLYHHPDWNQALHRSTRAFSVDTQTRVAFRAVQASEL